MIRRTILLLTLICWISSSSAQTNNKTIYEYDNLNRLIHVSYLDKEVYYSYDELGNRVRMMVLGASLIGDVNNDGSVSIEDVTTLVNIILEKETPVVSDVMADVNNDGNVNIADVTALINIILEKFPQSSQEVRQIIDFVGP